MKKKKSETMYSAHQGKLAIALRNHLSSVYMLQRCAQNPNNNITQRSAYIGVCFAELECLFCSRGSA